MAASFNKFQDFVEQLAKGLHQLHAAGHTYKVYLTNAAPSASEDAVKADLAEISDEHGYPAGGSDVQNDATETDGTLTMTAVDVVFTASGGTFGPFRYIVLYNDTMGEMSADPLEDPLVGWWDYGEAITPKDGEKFTVDFGASVLTIA